MRRRSWSAADAPSFLVPAMTRHAVRGRLVWFTDDPATAGTNAVRDIPDGAVVIEGSLIRAVGPAAEVLTPDLDVTHYPDALILPGLIDTHIHYAQTRVIGSYGAQLLDWLDRYTFPAERRFADPAYSASVAGFFLAELFRNGTTAAVVYPTVHACSVDAVCGAADRHAMRLLCGKIMMDDGPEGLRDTPEGGYRDSKALIERWHGRGRIGYAITPRFAVTSSRAQLEAAGALLAEHPDCWLQTHLSENRAEIRTVAERFPEARDYLDVYDRAGLLGPRSLFGHCIHLSAAERQRLHATGGVAVFCPTSNLFIGSGLFDLRAMRDPAAPVRVALATDVGGGTSYSLLRTAAEGYKVLQLQGQSWPAVDAFYAMTLGNARALGLETEIGTLAVGAHADLVVLEPAATPALAHRLDAIDEAALDERLFALMTMGDDRAVAATYVAGRKVHARDGFETIGEATPPPAPPVFF
jgi:guanine deaminase